MVYRASLCSCYVVLVLRNQLARKAAGVSHRIPMQQTTERSSYVYVSAHGRAPVHELGRLKMLPRKMKKATKQTKTENTTRLARSLFYASDVVYLPTYLPRCVHRQCRRADSFSSQEYETFSSNCWSAIYLTVTPSHLVFPLFFIPSAKNDLATAHAAMGGMGGMGAIGEGAGRRGGSVGVGGVVGGSSMSPSLDGIDGENLEHKVCGSCGGFAWSR